MIQSDEYTQQLITQCNVWVMLEPMYPNFRYVSMEVEAMQIARPITVPEDQCPVLLHIENRERLDVKLLIPYPKITIWNKKDGPNPNMVTKAFDTRQVIDYREPLRIEAKTLCDVIYAQVIYVVIRLYDR